jgi:hypothetical protein
MTYQNTETFQQSGGRKTVRRVSIKNGKGKKTVSYYSRGKRVETVTRPIMPSDVAMILAKKFIPGLFSDCKSRKRRYRK